MLCETFVRAPKRRQEPGYYEVVSSPMDFIKIQQKIKTDEYDEVEDMTVDVELLVNNAKAFYKVHMLILFSCGCLQKLLRFPTNCVSSV